MKEVKYILVSAQSMAADVTSAGQDLSFYWVFSMQAVFTGSPVGNIELQASNDNVTYTTIADTPTAVAAAGNIMWNIENAGYKWVRVFYDATSGTGSLTVTYFGKGQ